MKKNESAHNEKHTISRRDVIGGTAKLGLLAAGGVLVGSACARTNTGNSTANGGLPAQGEYLVRGAYVLSMDPDIGHLDLGDVHVKSGKIIAVAPDISAPAAEIIDATGMIVMPGFIDTHWHVARDLS